MTKRPSLFAVKAPDIDAEHVEITATAATKSKGRPPSREGKRVLSVYLTPEAWKQIRMLSLDLEVSAQALGEEAIKLLFEKHRLNRIS